MEIGAAPRCRPTELIGLDSPPTGGRPFRRARRRAALSKRAQPDRPLWVYRLIYARQSYFENVFARRPLAAAPLGRPPKGTAAKTQRPVCKLERRLAAAQRNVSAWTCRRLGATASARPPTGRPFKTRAARSPPFGFIDALARRRAISKRRASAPRERRKPRARCRAARSGFSNWPRGLRRGPWPRPSVNVRALFANIAARSLRAPPERLPFQNGIGAL